MKRAIMLMFGIALAPLGAQAQVQVGVDAGVSIDTGFEVRDNLTTISLPASALRIGFPAGEMITVETMLAFSRISSGGDSFSTLGLIPGVNVALGEGGFYLRGEGGLNRVSFDDDSGTQWTVGAAAGLMRAIGDGPVSFRLEAGYGRWLENDDFEGFNRIRFLMGISAAID